MWAVFLWSTPKQLTFQDQSTWLIVNESLKNGDQVITDILEF